MTIKSILEEIEGIETINENKKYLQAYGTRILNFKEPFHSIFSSVILQQGYYTSVCFSGKLPMKETEIDIPLIHEVCNQFFPKGKISVNKLKRHLADTCISYNPPHFSDTEPLLDVPFFREQNEEFRSTLLILPGTDRIFLCISDPDSKGIYPPFSSFIDHHFKGIGNSGKKVTEYSACFELMSDIRFPVCLNNYRRIESSIIQFDLKEEIRQSVFLFNEKRHRILINQLSEFMTELYGEHSISFKEHPSKYANRIIERKIWGTPLHDLHIESHVSIETNDPEGEKFLRMYKISFVPRTISKGRGLDWYYEKMALYIN